MYAIWDIETTTHGSYKRKANPFDKRNWIVAEGWKLDYEPCCRWEYRKKDIGRVLPAAMDLSKTQVLVGCNIKFDLLYNWRDPKLIEFFKRGGWVWDVLYAEYLLSGENQRWQLNSRANLNSLSAKYGGRQKIDAVKALWEQGVDTPDIPEDLLIDYLVGTEKEGRNSGDVGNTEKVFLAQVVRAQQLGMSKAIRMRMDGLCATTEMEYNGLKIDIDQAKINMAALEKEKSQIKEDLKQYLPELPKEFEFSWTNGRHLSAIIFGGAVKYEKRVPVVKDGVWQRVKEKTLAYYVGGEPVPLMDFDQCIPDYADKYVSGKRKGEFKTKLVTVPGSVKYHTESFAVSFPRVAEPDEKNATLNKDADGNPVYKTDDSSLEEIPDSAAPFMKKRKRLGAIMKELCTYYVSANKQGKLSGMLTCVDPQTLMVHPTLNHNATKTARLAGANPNPQNIPRKETGTVKQIFVSRFGKGAGLMIEADYSQLEIVVLGVLSHDKQFMEDIRRGIDFHCVRVAALKGCTYEEAVSRCKDENNPLYPEWHAIRTQTKHFSFQRSYGAGVKKIAASTGMSEEDVQALIDAEEKLYPDVSRFHKSVSDAIEKSAKPFFDPVQKRMFRIGWWQSPTGCIYSWRSYDAPAFLKKRGIVDTFKPTEIKNFPTQGTGGELVEGIAGKIWRYLLINDNFGGKALLVNTVHDCFWVDTTKELTEKIAKDVQTIMQAIPRIFNKVFPKLNITVPFKAAVDIGYNMYDMHGMDEVFKPDKEDNNVA